MNILVWHVHGSWMTAFVQGRHRYLVPVVPGRGPDGLGRARTWDWPDSVVEVAPEELADLPIDVVVLQRRRDLDLLEQWLPRTRAARPKLVHVEHDTPLDLRCPRHPLVDRRDVVIAHVTVFNATMWDTGTTRSVVIEHGVVDPGHRYTGELEAAVAAINEPVRRSWVAGTDLLLQVRKHVPVDLFGMRSESLGGVDVDQARLHEEMATRRAYLHPFRWTSLGLSLVEAMQLGMPVVALGATEVPRVLTPSTGAVAYDADGLAMVLRALLAEPAYAAALGQAARAHALDRFGLARFLDDWDRLLESL